MTNLKDLENLDIEFIPDFDITEIENLLAVENVRTGQGLKVVEALASKFKAELTQLGEKFAFNEDNEIFLPLRKYYSTALRYTLENHNPMDDPRFVTLKNDIGYGLEYVYYNEIVVPTLVDEIYHLFFIDHTHPLLYSLQDGDTKISFTSLNSGKYGYMNYGSMIREAIDPENKHSALKMTEEDFAKIWEETGMAGIMRPKWTKIYSDRLSVIYSKLALDYMKKNTKDLDNIHNLLDGLV